MTKAEKPGWRRCLGQLAFIAPMALAGLLLALGDIPAVTATVLVVGAWLWLAISVVVAIVQFWKAVGEATAKQKNPVDFLHGVPRICSWTCLLLLAVAAVALFAAGRPGLATATTIVLILRMAVAGIINDRREPNRCASAGSSDHVVITSVPGMIRMVTIAGTAWLALGPPPVWAASMILTWIWIITLLMIVAGSAGVFAYRYGPGWRKDNWERLRRSGVHPGMAKWPEPLVTPEPPGTARQQLVMWLWRMGSIAVTWALWTAGQPLLAGLYLLGWMVKISANVQEKRMKHGDSARIDFLARTVHFVVWWLLKTVVGAPFAILSAVWDRIMGPPDPPTSWEREARLENARIRRAGASYRLREAFGQSGGFVYFLYCEPHQKEHFMGPDGLLADLGERVIARDWREDMVPARKAVGWTRFQQTPEGALLHVNAISGMQKGMSFIAVVPPRGLVQVFTLSEPYRARRRDKGAALAQAEVEVMAAIEAVLKPGTAGASSC